MVAAHLVQAALRAMEVFVEQAQEAQTREPLEPTEKAGLSEREAVAAARAGAASPRAEAHFEQVRGSVLAPLLLFLEHDWWLALSAALRSCAVVLRAVSPAFSLMLEPWPATLSASCRHCCRFHYCSALPH